MPWDQQETLGPLREWNPCIAGDHRRHPSAGWRRRKHDPLLIDGVDAGCIARHQRIVDLDAHDLRLRRMHVWEITDLARPELERRRLSDKLAALGGVLFGKQALGRNLHEGGIAIVSVP